MIYSFIVDTIIDVKALWQTEQNKKNTGTFNLGITS